jgi:tetratricopeptide (TPR) repeat protein
LALYEQAVRALQQRQYAQASDLLSRLTISYPEERDLVERSRLYLTLCARQLTPPTAEPRDTQESLYAATLALNAGQTDVAISHLTRVQAAEPANDRALYLLAIAHAERREPDLALRYLQQAIEANPENRPLARVDPDLDVLRGAAGLNALLTSS